MRKLILSAFLASGLTLTGVSAFALDEQPHGAKTHEQMEQGTAPDSGQSEFDEESRTPAENTTSSEGVEVQKGSENTENMEQEGTAPDSGQSEFDEESRMPAEGAEDMQGEGTTTGRMGTESNSGERMGTESNSGEYVVKEGDTLSEIAKAQLGSEDKWQEIATANGLDDPDTIYVGQRLTIPSGSKESRFEDSGQIRPDAENQTTPTEPMEESMEKGSTDTDPGSTSKNY